MMQDAGSFLGLFTPLDLLGLALLLACLFGATLVIEHPPGRWPSTHILMGRYRLAWMEQMVAREVRIFDAQMLATLRQGATFFASTTLIAVGGGAAVLGQADRVEVVASGLDASLSAPLVVWEVKILTAMLVMGLAFLKFVWSIRLYGYCGLMMGAIPNDGSTEEAMEMARRAGRLSILADRSFTRALRSVYFALATLAWFLGPIALIVAVLATTAIIWRREFASQTRALVLEDLRRPKL